SDVQVPSPIERDSIGHRQLRQGCWTVISRESHLTCAGDQGLLSTGTNAEHHAAVRAGYVEIPLRIKRHFAKAVVVAYKHSRGSVGRETGQISADGARDGTGGIY